MPGAPILATHPKNVYLPERTVVDPVNAGIGGLSAPEHRDDTVGRLLDADATRAETARAAAADQAVTDAQQRLHRLHAAVEAGVDPVALVEPINRAQEELEAARSSVSGSGRCRRWAAPRWRRRSTTSATVDVALRRAGPDKLEELYEAMRLEVVYHPEEHAAEVTIRPGRGSERVRGGLAH